MYVKLSYGQYQMLLGLADASRQPVETRSLPSQQELRKQAAETVAPAGQSGGSSGARMGERSGQDAEWVKLAQKYAESAQTASEASPTTAPARG